MHDVGLDRPGRVLADGWYSWVIPSFRALTDLIERWPPGMKALTWRLGPLRALIAVAASTRYDALAVIRADIGWRSLLMIRALLGRRRKLVVLHFIDHPRRAAGIGGRVDRVWRPIDRWATRRAVLAAQVLSPWEADRYANEFGVEPERFRFIPFAWRMRPVGATHRNIPRHGVVAIGRASCDWQTLFAAARGRPWPLTVVCGGHDRPLVESLNVDRRAQVRCDIPHEYARELLGRAAVCVLPMYDAGISQGHVRLCDAVDAGAAVVASRTRSIEGYVDEGRTAVLVPVGDAEALRDAVEHLIADSPGRERLARAAFDRAAAWTWDDYLIAIEAFVERASRVGRASGLERT